MSFFLAAQRFGGTAFCRHSFLSAPGNKTPFLRILSRDPDIDPCAPSQTAVLPLFRAFPRASFLSPSASVFRKIGADFAL